MAFDQTAITSVRADVALGQMEVSWTTTAPAGATFQVYVRAALAWSGAATRCVLPAPAEGRTRVSVGVVGPGEAATDFSATLDAPPPDRVLLSWRGGTFLDATGGDDVMGYRIYAAATPGGPVVKTEPVAEVAAYEEGVIQDGWGIGGWGQGGWGKAATQYSWKSTPLRRGTWAFEVVAFDAVGQESPAASGSVAIAGPPPPPARDAAGRRLTADYDPTSGTAVLSWLPSED